jgi:hypothetical protein
MGGAIPPFPQYAFMAWCLVKVQGQIYLFLPLSKAAQLQFSQDHLDGYYTLILELCILGVHVCSLSLSLKRG